jgi:ankyrin repeat protein
VLEYQSVLKLLPLINVGADIHICDIYGYSALHRASLRGHVDIVRALLLAGATVDLQDNDRETPLYWAIYYNNQECARLLIDFGALIENVQIDECLTTIPMWIHEFVAARQSCRRAALTLIGIHKFHRTSITEGNDINVIRIIGLIVWNSCFNDVWNQTGNNAINIETLKQ